MPIHFAPDLAGEFTGYPHETELVMLRQLTSTPNTWEAVELISRPFGQLPAVSTSTAEGVSSFTDKDRELLLSSWTREFDRLRGEDVAPTPAWVFVELARRGSTRYYAAVRPSAGEAFAHVLHHRCHYRHEDWDWLHDENGNRLPGCRSRPAPRTVPTIASSGLTAPPSWPTASRGGSVSTGVDSPSRP